MRLAIVVAWIVGCSSVMASAQPQPAAPPPAPPTPPPLAPAKGPPERIPLSLQEAITLGIENNTDVQLIRFEPPIADYDYVAAWGAYDPTLFGNYLYSSSNIPTGSNLIGGQLQEWSNSGGAGITGLIPRLDWRYELDYTGSRLNSNSLIQTFGVTYNSGLTGKLVAPILKGAWWGGPWTEVQLTGVGTGRALEVFRRGLLNIIGGVPTGGTAATVLVNPGENPGIENFYWRLAARKQELEVANKSLETARALLEQEKAQYDVGVKSRVDVVQAEAGVADREFRQIQAENSYRFAQDQLINAVFGPRLTAISNIEIEPTDRPEDYITFALDPELSTQRAMERRPELRIAHDDVDQAEISLQYAKNQRLPQLDAVGSYGYRGLAGNRPNCPFSDIDPITRQCTITPMQPAGIPTHYSGTDSFFFTGKDNLTWTGGVVLSIPIPNTTARADVAISELTLRRAKTNVVNTEQTIVLEVRDAVRQLASALEGIEAAERGVAASQEQLRAEKIKLDHGESTPFEVLQKEQDLTTAESQRIAALRTYRGAVTSLDRAQGTLLEDRGIVLEDALPLR